MSDEVVDWTTKLGLEEKLLEAHNNAMVNVVEWRDVEELRDYLTALLDDHEENRLQFGNKT
jgi:hypothetical protein